MQFEIPDPLCNYKDLSYFEIFWWISHWTSVHFWQGTFSCSHIIVDRSKNEKLLRFNEYKGLKMPIWGMTLYDKEWPTCMENQLKTYNLPYNLLLKHNFWSFWQIHLIYGWRLDRKSKIENIEIEKLAHIFFGHIRWTQEIEKVKERLQQNCWY